MRTILFGLLIACAWRITLCTEDYCSPALCSAGVKHSACGTDGTFDTDACSANPVQVNLDGPLLELLLNKHNACRQQVASGNLANYAKASAMAQMYWDTDLAYVAGFLARTCRMQHDQCRATTRYPLSGQNLGYVSKSGAYMDDAEAINQLFDKWFAENQFASMDTIRSYQPATNGDEYGHFTELVQQRNGHVGCALVRYTSAAGDWFSTLLACNYAYSNVRDEPVYAEGAPASNCTEGVSAPGTQFTALCAAK